MTKLILMFLLLGLQNPLPALGIGESKPPHQEAKSEQSPASPNNAFSYSGAFFADFYYGHYHHNHRYEGTNDGQNESSPDGWMIFLTLLLVLVGAGQCTVYYFQWKTMIKSVDDARESSERGLRAYVSVSPGVIRETAIHSKEKPTAAPSFTYTYSIKIKNGGQTPAYNITSSFEWEYFEPHNANWPKGKPFKIRSSTLSAESSVTVGSQEEATLSGGLFPDQNELGLSAIYRKWQSQQGVLFIFGKVGYDDIYRKKRHITEFCHLIKQEANGRVTCEIHHLHNGAT